MAREEVNGSGLQPNTEAHNFAEKGERGSSPLLALKETKTG